MISSINVVYAVVSILLHALHASSLGSKMQIWVYPDRWSMKFSTTQKCYTFSACVGTSTVGADWYGIDDGVAMVFYEDEQCQGTQLISHALPKGQATFTFDKGAKSFMVWSDGIYPTNGIEHQCLERAVLKTTSNSSESASASATAGF
ncbi:hypothetical protein PF005_g33287 [Phytophthora fragariae]|uniref:GOLD domain-containing protein n=2 Tax=Phytophthora fragariae TaxID=53985 RepID=A0A6A3PAU7_9STRA|nr:hypothetical protein PF003_g17028 [Phytophthora fragariae]KAE8916583.1 hypothetical protein PF009_g33094 [Phytophthora fragariae]KAE8952757.1 hypothetical protein PF011_g32612 [Phytophthora fragariae]KAE9053518.1 hypothetical protein PF010_g32881 [Phytophthora fragariae]KAE9054631.1 hypothetical protein PF006_g33210 [Phytophthora fragariae]